MSTLASSRLLVIKPLHVSHRLVSMVLFAVAVIATFALLVWLAIISSDGQTLQALQSTMMMMH